MAPGSVLLEPMSKPNVMQAFCAQRPPPGPPGAGTSMLARRLTTILPAMTLAEAIETTRIHRVAGLTGDRTALVTIRPCRAPHQTIADAGLIGDGHVPLPGEVSLAHHGVCLLDELPECRRHVLEVWRPPLENGLVTIARPSMSVTYTYLVLRIACFVMFLPTPPGQPKQPAGQHQIRAGEGFSVTPSQNCRFCRMAL